ncbi:WxL domain-containing protein [Weissella confusa]|uniref:WxL domain-containing protein n=1 Tax=Weissella confusa TaxID=1583 RepID=A0AAJ3DAQ3_WEICO|nr:WxL domain-containing protein [Weissella confusa]NBA10965.1 hypothetical protein [Weissella confusa]
MKKTVILATTAVLGGLLASSVAFADTPAASDDTTQFINATTGKSVAKVSLAKPDSNNTTPDVPGKPGTKPGDGGNGNTNNADLMLNYVSHFDFGHGTISDKQLLLPVNKISASDGTNAIKTVPYAKVSDMRGTAAGWHLTVAQDDEFTASDATDAKGAKATIKGAEIQISTVKPVDGAGNPTGTVVTGTPVTLTAGGQAHTIMNAPDGQHVGAYSAMFGDNSEAGDTTNGVQLMIPGNSALAGNYTTHLTWTLANTPE